MCQLHAIVHGCSRTSQLTGFLSTCHFLSLPGGLYYPHLIAEEIGPQARSLSQGPKKSKMYTQDLLALRLMFVNAIDLGHQTLRLLGSKVFSLQLV